jgi:hypothetical protein
MFMGDDSTLYRSRQQARAVRFVCLVGPVLLAAYAVLPVGSAVMRVAALVVGAALPILYWSRLAGPASRSGTGPSTS